MKIFAGIAVFFFSIFISAGADAQNGKVVIGLVKDTADSVLQGCTVKLVSDKDSIITHTHEDGRFIFKVVYGSYVTLTFSATGFSFLGAAGSGLGGVTFLS